MSGSMHEIWLICGSMLMSGSMHEIWLICGSMLMMVILQLIWCIAQVSRDVTCHVVSCRVY